jgi:hypothetical protein
MSRRRKRQKRRRLTELREQARELIVRIARRSQDGFARPVDGEQYARHRCSKDGYHNYDETKPWMSLDRFTAEMLLSLTWVPCEPRESVVDKLAELVE